MITSVAYHLCDVKMRKKQILKARISCWNTQGAILNPCPLLPSKDLGRFARCSRDGPRRREKQTGDLKRTESTSAPPALGAGGGVVFAVVYSRSD
ncbi:hypothetical protein Zmor_024391 [Zophobas morio]|uniref:Uncharacterized protein n=1 Tax=Zophobas morio TaxID=2755281 RepID=A0AA38M7N4_9CUCU|nr:hypothetical protein Zmor_024390 [Zophobas morio]KAJ3646821.1 hypothetical protein Zmor_024391 [Zophobas morio]